MSVTVLWCGRCGCIHLSEDETCLKAWERRGDGSVKSLGTSKVK